VEVREAAFDDPAFAAEVGAVLDAALGDDGLDPASPEQPAVLVVVIAAIAQETIGLAAGAAALSSDRPRVEVL